MLLIKNGTLHTLESEHPIQSDIFLKDSIIREISPNIPQTPDMTVIDAEGLSIYPGFIDAHSHIGLVEEKVTPQCDPCNEDVNPITPTLRAIDGINPMDSAFHNAIAAGITGVMIGPGSANAIGGQFAFLKTYGRCVEDQIVLAPSAMKIAFGENPISNYGANGNAPATRMGIASLIREELHQAREYFTKEPDEKNFRLETYRELFEKKIPLKAHVHRADDILTAIRIAREFGLDLTLDHCTEGHLIAEKLAEYNYPAIVGPTLTSRSKDEVRLLDFKTPGILSKVGITVALTTDHPVTRIQYLPLCAGLAAKEGMGEYQALRSITIDAAKICRVDQRVGSLKEGKDADLIICKGNPLEISGTILYTIINGEIVWEQKKTVG